MQTQQSHLVYDILYTFYYCNWYSHGKKKTVRDIGRRSSEVTGNRGETLSSMQGLSVALQLGDVSNILCSEGEKQRYFGS